MTALKLRVKHALSLCPLFGLKPFNKVNIRPKKKIMKKASKASTWRAVDNRLESIEDRKQKLSFKRQKTHGVVERIIQIMHAPCLDLPPFVFSSL